MKKPSQILRSTKVRQIRDCFIEFDKNEKVFGKCALGVLACRSPDKSLHLSYSKRNVDCRDIIKSYGIEYFYVPYLTDDCDWNFKLHYSLVSIIIKLNDYYKFSFKEIADFLEVTFDL